MFEQKCNHFHTKLKTFPTDRNEYDFIFFHFDLAPELSVIFTSLL